MHLLGHHEGDDGGRDQLGVRMLEARTGLRTVILEDDHRAEALIALQVDDPIPTRAYDVLDRAGRQGREVAVVIRRLDEQLVGPDAVHEVVEALAAAFEVPFDAQRRELVRNDAYTPARRVGRRRG